jgi:hypothetical protein
MIAPPARSALDLDIAAAMIDEPIELAQSKPVPLPTDFIVKRLEDSGHDLGRNTDAGVHTSMHAG